jgi:hypothetical protein
VPTILVSRPDVVPGLAQCARQVSVMNQDGIGRKIVKQGGGLIEEQRHVEFDPRGRNTLTDAAIDRRPRRVSFEAGAKPPAEFPHAVRIERDLTGGQQAHAVERVERPLRIRVETPYGLDLVVEQVNAQRRSRPHRVHVEQRAANGIFTRTGDLTHAGIAGFDQALPERLQLQRLADRKLECAALDIVARRQPLHEHVGCHDQASGLYARQLEERPQALRCDIGMGREQVVGQHLPVGKRQQRQPFAREKLQLGRKALELACVVRDDDVQPLVRPGRFGKRQRSRAAIQLMPAEAS